MAIVNFTGFETAAALSGEYWDFAGNFSLSATAARTGAYGLRINPTTTATGYMALSSITASGACNSSISAQNTYITFHFQYITKAASNSEEILYTSGESTSGRKGSLRLNSTGTISVYDATNTLVATGATVLSASTWYQIEFKQPTGPTASYELRINGVTELSGTMNASTSIDTSMAVYFGKFSNSNGNSVDYYYDDCVVSNSDFYGNVKIAGSAPNANGSTMQWTSGTAPSDYTTVDERPPNGADYVMNPASASQTALFRFNTCATMGIPSTATIFGLKATIQVRENASTTSANAVTIKSGASSSTSTNSNYGTTANSRSRLLVADPSTTSYWTNTAVDAVEAGSIETNAVQMRLEAVALQVMYSTTPRFNNAMVPFL